MCGRVADDAVGAAIVARALHVGEPARTIELFDGRGLARADLHRERATGNEPARRLLDDLAHEVEAIGPAVEREVRLVIADVGLQCRDLARRDVRRVRDDQIITR